jgi:hypothetical protein
LSIQERLRLVHYQQGRVLFVLHAGRGESAHRRELQQVSANALTYSCTAETDSHARQTYSCAPIASGSYPIASGASGTNAPADTGSTNATDAHPATNSVLEVRQRKDKSVLSHPLSDVRLVRAGTRARMHPLPASWALLRVIGCATRIPATPAGMAGCWRTPPATATAAPLQAPKEGGF